MALTAAVACAGFPGRGLRVWINSTLSLSCTSFSFFLILFFIWCRIHIKLMLLTIFKYTIQ